MVFATSWSFAGIVSCSVDEAREPARLDEPARLAVIGSRDRIVHEPGAAGAQSAPVIAIDDGGAIVVVGFEDARGRLLDPPSAIGLARSADGGETWSELSPLAVEPGGELRGEPDVGFDRARNRFVLAARYLRADGTEGVALYLSNAGPDAGAQWSGPVDVTPSFVPLAAIGSTSLDVNPTTGRIFVTWSRAGGGPDSIETARSDDGGMTWTAPVALAVAGAGESVFAAQLRVIPGGDDDTATAYAVWTAQTAAGRNIACARSVDGGATWTAATQLDPEAFPAPDQIPGVDSPSTAASLAVDHTTGQVYAAYQRNDADGTGDIAVAVFTGACRTAAPVLLSTEPGADGAQLYPSVAVDQVDHTAYVMWLDQSIGQSIGQSRGESARAGAAADATQAMLTASSDGGASWRVPTPISDRPFRAGFGDDGDRTGRGDYNRCAARGGAVHCAWAGAPASLRFDDGQPGAAMTAPDIYHDRRRRAQPILPVRIAYTSEGGGVTVTEQLCGEGGALGNGAFDPGDRVALTVALESYAGNPAVGEPPLASLHDVRAILRSDTPDVTVESALAEFGVLAPADVAVSDPPFIVAVGSQVPPGTPLDLVLVVAGNTEDGLPATVELPVELRAAEPTRAGSPGEPQVLFAESFDAAGPGLPTGWASIDEAGAADPWQIDAAFTGSPAAFHDNDGEQAERIALQSPEIAIPDEAAGGEIALAFDLRYDLEDRPERRIEARDGLAVRLIDRTPGRPERRVSLDAFAIAVENRTADEKTFLFNGLSKQLALSGGPDEVDGAGVWSGDSGGLVRVTARLPGDGLAGSTVQLSFEHSEDAAGTCQDAGHSGPCGVAIDDVRFSYIAIEAAPCPRADLVVRDVGPTARAVSPGDLVFYNLVVTNAGPDAATDVVFRDVAPEGATAVEVTGDGWDCAVDGREVTCARDSLASGEGAPLSLAVRVSDDRTQVANESSVHAATHDPNTSNNVAASFIPLEGAGCSCRGGAGAAPPWPLLAVVVLAFVVLAVSRRRDRGGRRRTRAS